jgi:hypothetical protein
VITSKRSGTGGQSLRFDFSGGVPAVPLRARPEENRDWESAIRAHVSRVQDEASSAPSPAQDERREGLLSSTHDHEGHDRSVEPGRHAAINALHQPANGVFRR